MRFVLSAIVLTAIACSSEARDYRSSLTRPGPGADAGFVGEPSSSEAGTSGSAVGAVTPGSECATASAGATRPNAHLVFMVDRSISMGFAIGATTGWEACKAGLNAFFAAPSSTGLRASLAFFGKDETLDSTLTCTASGYAKPEVPIKTLPDATSFANAIGATKPFTGTPTLPALRGAIQYATTIQASVPANEKVAVVLVTDGGPTGCAANNTLDTLHDEAFNAKIDGILTYVIGIGKIQNLQKIADGAGTTAIEVNTSSPTQLTGDLEAALGQVGAKALGCEYVLPSPPQGQALDVNAVNVSYTPAGGAQQTLPYSADCADKSGWHYDSVANPKSIVACDDACNTLSSDEGGKVEIFFGCKTFGAQPR